MDREEFMKKNMPDRLKREKIEQGIEDIVNLFESKGFGFGGWDERTVDVMLTSLLSLMIDKKVFTKDELAAKIDDIKLVREA